MPFILVPVSLFEEGNVEKIIESTYKVTPVNTGLVDFEDRECFLYMLPGFTLTEFEQLGSYDINDRYSGVTSRVSSVGGVKDDDVLTAYFSDIYGIINFKLIDYRATIKK